MTYKKIKLPYPKHAPREGNAHVVVGWKTPTHGLDFICQLSEADADLVMRMAITLSKTVPTANVNAVPELKATVAIPDDVQVGWMARIKKIVADQLGVPPSMVEADTNFVETLGADSLDLMELVLAIEDEFDITIPNEEAERCHNPADILDLLVKLTA